MGVVNCIENGYIYTIMRLFSSQISFPCIGFFLVVKVFSEILLLYILLYILLAPWRDPGRESKQGKEIINQSINQSIDPFTTLT